MEVSVSERGTIQCQVWYVVIKGLGSSVFMTQLSSVFLSIKIFLIRLVHISED